MERLLHTQTFPKKIEVLKKLPKKPEKENRREEISKILKTSGHKLVVLDDDPTGVQTVHDIYVITDWGKEWIRKGLEDDRNVLYILTNTRCYPEGETERINREIVENLVEVARELNVNFSIISRGDSTLRGHYPLEMDVLCDQLKKSAGAEISGHLIVPAFFEAGRFTIDNIHYLAEGENLVPVSDTEFSRDAVFGFSTSCLPDWINEKTGGKVSAENVIVLSIEDIRKGGVEKVVQKLLRVEHNTPIIVNAAAYEDLDIVSLAVLQAIGMGKQFLFRTAASFVKSLGGVLERPYLTAAELHTAKDQEKYGGLIMVGSHTKKTTEQIETLMNNYPVETIEVSVAEILDGKKREAELERVIIQLEINLLSKKDTIVFTSRNVVKVEGKEDNLKIGQAVSSSLVEIVRSLKIKPRFIIAKGGITSSDIATKGLEIKMAKILGQVSAGVPVWFTGEEARFKETSYIVFPGNVGDKDSILRIVENLSEQKGCC